MRKINAFVIFADLIWQSPFQPQVDGYLRLEADFVEDVLYSLQMGPLS